MANWLACKKILCIRVDNMGDVIMTGPALRALKDTIGCQLTLLTSNMGALIVPHMPEIDHVIVHDVPWVKTVHETNAEDYFALVQQLKAHAFDGAIIFNVYSQNALPAAMLAFMAGIPLRLAYCRENPYALVSDWLPDREPFTFIQHQVERDLALVRHIGVIPQTDLLQLSYDNTPMLSAGKIMASHNVDIKQPYIILHPGVSEKKREYPAASWIKIGELLKHHFNYPIFITGGKNEVELAKHIQLGIGENTYVVAGAFSISEFIATIDAAALVVSVNTSTVHIAAAFQTPLVVLYAMTNPQHTPWKSPSKVLYFPVNQELKSKNQIVEFVSNQLAQPQDYPTPAKVLVAAQELLAAQQSS